MDEPVRNEFNAVDSICDIPRLSICAMDGMGTPDV